MMKTSLSLKSHKSNGGDDRLCAGPGSVIWIGVNFPLMLFLPQRGSSVFPFIHLVPLVPLVPGTCAPSPVAASGALQSFQPKRVCSSGCSNLLFNLQPASAFSPKSVYLAPC